MPKVVAWGGWLGWVAGVGGWSGWLEWVVFGVQVQAERQAGSTVNWPFEHTSEGEDIAERTSRTTTSGASGCRDELTSEAI